MDSIELTPMFRDVLESISLNKEERIPGLELIIHPDYIVKPCPVITHRRPASPAK